ncbi:ABC transporter ATP-binding protein [Amycolatopsis jejuensis]|uniref:ABC transporter ATP-binding protein n=1 Tax=Amycolatopsis jejuensis TaxID=330084 RepID=UPI000525FB22|nr:ATP-binding cassette domain-containing protein [Amycolatopsis jejuensis]
MTGELSTTGLTVRYGYARAVHSVDLAFRPATVNALVGPNGAGKTSLLLALSGGVRAEGAVLLDGEDITAMPAAERARRGFALVPQGRQIFPTLTVRENLEVMAEVLRVKQDAVDAALDRFANLRRREKAYAGVLSGGEQQMLAVSRALMGPVRVALFDEVATGLAPVIVEEIGQVIRELAEQGTTVVLAAPSLGTLASCVDRGEVLIRGEVVAAAEDPVELERYQREWMGLTA